MNQNYFVPIKQWAVEERPREKLATLGIASLSDAEILAILIGTGTKDQSAIDIARKLLKELGGINNLGKAGIHELVKTKGIGKAKAITLIAAFELNRRRERSETKPKRINSPEQAAAYLKPLLADLPNEIFYVVFLDKANQIIAEKTLFTGGVSSTIVDTKMIFKEATQILASSIIAAHNHPSGSLDPSEADIALTQKMAKAGQLLDITVVDHLIISHKGFFSFALEGRLNS